MAKRAPATVGQVLRAAATAAGAAVSDRELLRRFADSNDQAAFAALVARHTGMVLGVCRRALTNPQDAEDACQATFLVLAKKAKSGRWQQSVANWLYTTARRVAHNARVAAQRRARREGRAAVPEAVQPVDRITGRELLAALDEELDRLPPHYREPLVLCYLEGLTRDEAARRLGVPAATLKAQLERGRKRLGDALTGRGCALGAGLLALAATSPAGASPPRLIQAVLAATTGQAPAAVAALAEGVAVNGLLNKSVLAVLALAGAAALALGIGAIAPSPASQPPEKAMPALPAQVRAPDAKPAPGTEKDATVSGRVLGPDGLPVAGAKLALVLDEAGAPAPQPTAGPDGRFAFRLPPPAWAAGKWRAPRQIIATAPGFGADWATLATGESRSDVTLRLTADLPITGRVIDLQGRPVAGATVAVHNIYAGPAGAFDTLVKDWKRFANDQEQAAGKLDRSIWNRGGLGKAFHTTTAADGTFTLAGFGQDRVVTLLVSGDGIADTFASVATRAGFDPTEAPQTHTRLYAPNFTLAVSPDKPVTGVVRDEKTKAPLPGVRVSAASLVPLELLLSRKFLFHNWPTPTVTTDAQGRFTLRGLEKARAYILVADPDEGAEHLHRFGYVPDTIGFAPVTTGIDLPRGVVLTGRVTDAATGAGVSSRVFYRPLENNEFLDRFSGYGPPDLPAPWHWGRDTQTDADGRYIITVAPGAGVLNVQADNLGGYQMARATKQEVADGIVDEKFGHFRCVGQGGMYNPEFMNFYKVIRPALTDRAAFLDVTLQPKAAPPAPNAPETTVTGRVLAPDGKSLAGAKLVFLGKGEAATEVGTAAAEGRFTVQVPKGQGRSYLIARADGVGLDFVELSELKSGAEIELRTVRDRPIHGRVVDTQGRPVAGARVAVNSVNIYAGNSLDPFLAEWKTRHPHSGFPSSVKSLWREAGLFPVTTTDMDGRFTIPGTGAERLVSLRLSRDGIADIMVSVANRDGFDPQPYNQVTTDKIATMGLAGVGPTWLLHGPDLSLVAEAEKPIRGVVQDLDTGRPRAGVRVWLSYDGNENVLPTLTATTDAAGRYEIHGARKARRSYVLEVASDPAAGFMACQVRAADTPGYSPIIADIGMKKGVIITGRVLDAATGKPLPGFAGVGVPSDNPFVKNYPSFDSSAWMRTNNTGEDGTFRCVTIPGPVVLMGGPDIRRMPDGDLGRYKYKPVVPDPKYPQFFSNRPGHDMLLCPNGIYGDLIGNFCKVLVIEPGTEVVRHDIIVEPATALPVSIRDADGRPLAGTWVAGISPEDWHNPTRIETDACAVYHLQPGRPRLLVAWEPTRKLVGSLALTGDEKGPAVVKLGPTGIVQGRLLDEDGRPLAGLTVILHHRDRSAGVIHDNIHRAKPVVTDASGAFRIDEVIPGPRFTLWLRRGQRNFVPAAKFDDRSVKPGETLDVGDLKAKPPDGAGE